MNRKYTELQIKQYLDKYDLTNYQSMESRVLIKLTSNLTNNTFMDMLDLLIDGRITFDELNKLPSINETICLKIIRERNNNANQVAFIKYNFPESEFKKLIASKITTTTAEEIINLIKNDLKTKFDSKKMSKYNLLKDYRIFISNNEQYIQRTNDLITELEESQSKQEIIDGMKLVLEELGDSLFLFQDVNEKFDLVYSNIEIIFRELFDDVYVNKTDLVDMYNELIYLTANNITTKSELPRNEYKRLILINYVEWGSKFDFKPFFDEYDGNQLYILYSRMSGVFSYIPEFFGIEKYTEYLDLVKFLKNFKEHIDLTKEETEQWLNSKKI